MVGLKAWEVRTTYLDTSQGLEIPLQLCRRNLGGFLDLSVREALRLVEEQQNAHLIGGHIQLVLLRREVDLSKRWLSVRRHKYPSVRLLKSWCYWPASVRIVLQGPRITLFAIPS